MLRLDHLVVTAPALGQGAAWVEARLGVTLSDIGRHGQMGTHNRLMSLGGEEYFEVIAIDPDGKDPGRPRWYDLDRVGAVPALTHWVLACDDLDEAIARCPGIGQAMDLRRGPYRWRMAVPEDGHLPFDGIHPALIQWQSDHPAPRLASSGTTLTRLSVRHPDAARLAAQLQLSDDRIVVEPGPVGLAASFQTPLGAATLP